MKRILLFISLLSISFAANAQVISPPSVALTSYNKSFVNPTITGGTINNTTIGATTPSTGKFTTLGVGTGADASAIVDVHQVGNTIPMIQAQDGGTQSSSSGGIFQATMDNGAAIASGTRIGVYQFSGDNGDSVKRIGAAINGIATELWSSIANGTQLKFNVTANGATTRTTALTLNQDTSAVFSGIVTTSSGRVLASRVVIAAGAVTITTADDIIVINKTSGAATTVNLMATPATGTILTIKDGKGDAATNNITITPNAGNIDGAATAVINTNYGSFNIMYNGTQWNII